MSPEQQSAPQMRANYEVQLAGRVPAALRAAFPVVGIRSTPAETVLTTEVKQGAELDTLLDKLLSMGLVLTAVHEREVDPDGEGHHLGNPRKASL